MSETMSGAALIAAERERQKSVEGWTPEHDDEHDNGQLSEAAIAYIRVGLLPGVAVPGCLPPVEWRWDEEWWKPSSDPIRNLVKAGALIAAEIDRLQRAALYERDSRAEPAR